jgi:hypothetical protein
VLKGNMKGLKQLMLKNSAPSSIVHIRGHNMLAELNLDDEPMETLMWNPLHFAVYLGNLEMV